MSCNLWPRLLVHKILELLFEALRNELPASIICQVGVVVKLSDSVGVPVSHKTVCTYACTKALKSKQTRALAGRCGEPRRGPHCPGSTTQSGMV